MVVWKTVWEIAGRRNSTKIGQGHLSDHCFTVLQSFVQEEARRAMENAVGKNVMILRVE